VAGSRNPLCQVIPTAQATRPYTTLTTTFSSESERFYYSIVCFLVISPLQDELCYFDVVKKTMLASIAINSCNV